MKPENLLEKIREIPFVDPHTHVDSAHLGARGLDDILLYHMVVSDLYNAGCPDGSRLSEAPSPEEAQSRLERAIPYLPKIVNTSCYWGTRMILKDLYGVNDPVTMDNWRYIHDMIAERKDDRAWHREILRRAGIAKVVTEYGRRGDRSNDDILEYSQEWAFFTRAQWGKFDAALLELEYAWNHEESCSPLPVTTKAEDLLFDKKIRSLEDVYAAIRHYCEKTPEDVCTNSASHLSTDIHYRNVSVEEMEAALKNRDRAGERERDIYANFIQQEYMRELDRRNSPLILQFSVGAEPLPYETCSYLHSDTAYQFAEVIARYPKRLFTFSLSSAAHNQQFCTIARELPNVVMVGYWWHNFFPTIIRQVISERLDMLSLEKQIGYFSDAYCLEWVYAKSQIIRRQFAQVLSQRINAGQYDEKTALDIVKTICLETPQKVFGITPNPALLKR